MLVDEVVGLIMMCVCVIVDIEIVMFVDVDGCVFVCEVVVLLLLLLFINFVVDGYVVCVVDILDWFVWVLLFDGCIQVGGCVQVLIKLGYIMCIFMGVLMLFDVDIVFMQEDVCIDEVGRIVLLLGLKVGVNVWFVGEDILQGYVVFCVGQCL